MTEVTLNHRFKMRADTQARWTSFNPTLYNKEPALILDPDTGTPTGMVVGKTDTPFSNLSVIPFIQPNKTLAITTDAFPQIAAKNGAAAGTATGYQIAVGPEAPDLTASPHEFRITATTPAARSGFGSISIQSRGFMANGSVFGRSMINWANDGTNTSWTYGVSTDTGSNNARVYRHIVETRSETGITVASEQREVFQRDGTWSIKRSDSATMLQTVPWNIASSSTITDYLRIAPPAAGSGMPVYVTAASVSGDGANTRMALQAGLYITAGHPLATTPTVRVEPQTTDVNGWSFIGGASNSGGSYVVARTYGADATIAQVFQSKGAGSQTFCDDAGNINFQVLTYTNGATRASSWVHAGGSESNAPFVGASGSAAAVNLSLRCKGFGAVTLGNATYPSVLSVIPSPNASDSVNIVSGDDAPPPGNVSPNRTLLIGAAGVNNNVDLLLRAKGAGSIRFGALSVVAGAPPVTGYIQIRDELGNIRKLAVID